MKKITRLLFSLLTLIGISGLFSRVEAAPVLKVGIQTEATNHNSSAFDRRLALQIGQKLHRKVIIRQYRQQFQLEEAVADHQLDLAMGFSTPRLKNVYQTQPYLYIKNVMLSTKSRSLTGLQNKKVGILDESGQGSMLTQLQFKPQKFVTVDQLVNALDQNQVKAILLNQYQYNLYLDKHPEREKAAQINNSSLKLPPFKKIDDPQILSQQLFAITNDDQLAKQVSQTINWLRMSGMLTKLSAKYYQYNYAFK